MFEDNPKPFLDHLAELRRTLLGSLAAWAAGIALMTPFIPQGFDLLRRPLARVTDQPEQFLRSLEILGGFSIALQIALWGGLMLGAPVILWLGARFVLPGLTRRERRVLLGALAAAAGLFALGVALGYAITLPVALQVMVRLHAWLGVRVEWTAVNYVAFAVRLLLAFGLAFELPAVLVALGFLGLLPSDLLRSKRRHAIVVILCLAMFLTPGPDVFSQVIMAAPMVLLYELCIWIIRAAERRRP